jgi:hypothetical protein
MLVAPPVVLELQPPLIQSRRQLVKSSSNRTCQPVNRAQCKASDGKWAALAVVVVFRAGFVVWRVEISFVVDGCLGEVISGG